MFGTPEPRAPPRLEPSCPRNWLKSRTSLAGGALTLTWVPKFEYSKVSVVCAVPVPWRTSTVEETRRIRPLGVDPHAGGDRPGAAVALAACWTWARWLAGVFCQDGTSVEEVGHGPW